MTIDHWQEIKGAARAHTQAQIDQLGMQTSRCDAEQRNTLLHSLYDRLDIIDRWHPERGEIPSSPATWAPPVNRQGWIGIDLDGCMAHFDRWRGSAVIGSPIAPIVELAKRAIAEGGYDVRILTVRVSPRSHPPADVEDARRAITAWTVAVFGRALEVTCEKDVDMVELWDDRAVGVEPNTGRLLSASRLFPQATTTQAELPGLRSVKRSRKRK